MHVLKKIANPESTKPYHGLTKLPKGYHLVLVFRESIGQFGRSIIAELEDEIIFLPKYLIGRLTEQDVNDLNACNEKMYLFFGGMHTEHK